MDRRTFLRRAATVGGTASLVGLAGCLDGGSRAGDGQRSFTKTYDYDTATRTPKPEFVSKGAPTFSKPDENHVVVGLTVVNKTDAKGTTAVTAIVDFRKRVEATETDTGTTTKTVTRKRTKSVTLAAGASETVEFEFDIPAAASFDDVQFEIGSK